jgi:hypothetical protein
MEMTIQEGSESVFNKALAGADASHEFKKPTSNVTQFLDQILRAATPK